MSDSDEEEQEIIESRGKVAVKTNKEISAGQLDEGLHAQAEPDDFLTAADQMLWNKAPLASGKTRCPCF